jgi:CheY-like chemotaxis protein
MKPKRILVVDDEARVREMIDFRLRLFGYEVLHAEDGKEALAIASKEKPDLVLLDVMMPELDGFQVCKRLKQHEKTRDIPVVMLTAKAEAKDVTRAFNSGAVDYVVKPYDPTVLQQKVAQSLGSTAGVHS